MVVLDRAAIHALIDIVIDEAQKDIREAGGYGLSLQGAHGPNVSIMFVAGDHQEYSPRGVVTSAMNSFNLFTHIFGEAKSINKPGVPVSEMKARMQKNLEPKPLSPN